MDASPFTRLSPELRNTIYEFVFTSDYAITLQYNGTQHALTKTCRQFRHETLRMYYSLARLNAHLDDGPATPLAQWLKTIGRENCLLLNEINIWDMHMLNATLHGSETTHQLLQSQDEEGKHYILKPIGSRLLDRGWYLHEILVALHSMGLALQMLCLTTTTATTAEEKNDRLQLTSHYAITPLPAAGKDLDRYEAATMALRVHQSLRCGDAA